MLELWNKLFKLKTYAWLSIAACLFYGVGEIQEGKSYLEAIDTILIPLILSIIFYVFLYFRDKSNK